ncbi:MAG: Crp/Fnr family transcriptional regulator [Caulobacteraceae bacterium]|nr:Crp/Fnr family transcriptional regulator [Caulobacter sp.]
MLAQQMQATPRELKSGVEAVLRRLGEVGACSPELAAQVRKLDGRVESHRAGVTLQTEGERALRPRYLFSGWACRFRDLSDGRRQIVDFVLPGEGIGICLRPHAHATTTLTLTPVVLADAASLMAGEDGAASSEHAALVERVADADERRLLGALVRLGRMSALERLAHLLLELESRLAVVGLAGADGFPMPVTQESLADVLGLSVVHVNRTIQELRREGVVAMARGHVRIEDRQALESLADA